MEEFIIDEFYQEMLNVELSAIGILDGNCLIHSLGTDSKLVGRIFEIFTQPILEKIAEKHGLLLKTPESQTSYPDFILMKNEESKEKIAVDVKTTYINDDDSTIKFTLGSFGSYMRDNKKNIEYSYTDYAKHYVIGFVYKRNGGAQESKIYEFNDRKNIIPPYSDVRYFIQEKYKIAGDKPGSGNTENIGSISTKVFDDFKEGNGPFNKLGDDIYNIYWKYYPKYRKKKKGAYHSLDEFFQWYPKHKKDVKLLKDYSYKTVEKLIEEYKKTCDNK